MAPITSLRFAEFNDPDVLWLILHELPRADLASCSVVNHAFNEIATPLLYHHVLVGYKPSTLAHRSSRPAPGLIDLSRRYEKHTRMLSFRDHDAAECACECLDDEDFRLAATQRRTYLDLWVGSRFTQGWSTMRKPFEWTLVPQLAKASPFPRLETLVLHADDLLHSTRPNHRCPAFMLVQPKTVVIWNSGGYLSRSVLELIDVKDWLSVEEFVFIAHYEDPAGVSIISRFVQSRRRMPRRTNTTIVYLPPISAFETPGTPPASESSGPTARAPSVNLVEKVLFESLEQSGCQHITTLYDLNQSQPDRERVMVGIAGGSLW